MPSIQTNRIELISATLERLQNTIKSGEWAKTEKIGTKQSRVTLEMIRKARQKGILLQSNHSWMSTSLFGLRYLTNAVMEMSFPHTRFTLYSHRH